jgi:hypothetical protein
VNENKLVKSALVTFGLFRDLFEGLYTDFVDFWQLMNDAAGFCLRRMSTNIIKPHSNSTKIDRAADYTSKSIFSQDVCKRMVYYGTTFRMTGLLDTNDVISKLLVLLGPSLVIFFKVLLSWYVLFPLTKKGISWLWSKCRPSELPEELTLCPGVKRVFLNMIQKYRLTKKSREAQLRAVRRWWTKALDHWILFLMIHYCVAVINTNFIPRVLELHDQVMNPRVDDVFETWMRAEKKDCTSVQDAYMFFCGVYCIPFLLFAFALFCVTRFFRLY